MVVVLVVAGAVVWWISPARHAHSVTATTAPAEVVPATTVPAAFASRWSARSAATDQPALARAVIVTADRTTVTGHDPTSGRPLWSYDRSQSLCSAAAAWPSSVDEVLAVYRNSRGCSEVTALDGSTGARKAARTSDADDTLRLFAGSGYVLAQGPGRLETWGSNLVRGIEYGRVSAPVKPGVQPGRTDCHLYSSTLAGDRVAVIERCAGDPGYRLTVLGALLDSNDQVTQYGSTLITERASDDPPRLVAMSTSGIAVYDGGTNAAASQPPSIRLFNADGAPGASSEVKGSAQPPADSVATFSDGLVTYFTGQATVVLDAQSLRPRYQIPAALGPGAVMGGQLLLPSPSGISVRDPATGADIRTVKLDRRGYTGGTVGLRVLGDLVVEQRGPLIEVYGPRG
ncbi:hypothetical protein ACLQ3C_08450 [Gordonia sp. DT30]|uniref:Rv3212 family protein n=1 Tax=unclassified Gordonia (in: high G+C Gram-positive bacteria) TaxID=2657482 RepID=UPI003CE8D15F